MSIRGNEEYGREVWIGLAHVVLNSHGHHELGEGKGAYVNVLATAVDRHDFEARVEETLESLALGCVKVEDSERLRDRLSHRTVAETLLVLADKARETRSVQFGSFHVYEAER